MRKLCQDLKKEFDYILIDCPAGIEQGFRNAVAGADQAVVVTTARRSLPSATRIGLSASFTRNRSRPSSSLIA